MYLYSSRARFFYFLIFFLFFLHFHYTAAKYPAAFLNKSSSQSFWKAKQKKWIWVYVYTCLAYVCNEKKWWLYREQHLNLVQPLPVHWQRPSLALAPDDRTGIVSNFRCIISQQHIHQAPALLRIPKKKSLFLSSSFTRHSKISDSFLLRAQQLSQRL